LLEAQRLGFTKREQKNIPKRKCVTTAVGKYRIPANLIYK